MEYKVKGFFLVYIILIYLMDVFHEIKTKKLGLDKLV